MFKMQMKVLSRCVVTCVAAVNAAELMRIVQRSLSLNQGSPQGSEGSSIHGLKS